MCTSTYMYVLVFCVCCTYVVCVRCGPLCMYTNNFHTHCRTHTAHNRLNSRYLVEGSGIKIKLKMLIPIWREGVFLDRCREILPLIRPFQFHKSIAAVQMFIRYIHVLNWRNRKSSYVVGHLKRMKECEHFKKWELEVAGR